MKQHVATRCKPSTQEFRRSVELFISPFFGNQRVRPVQPADVAELHGSMAHIPYQAIRTLLVFSKVMNLSETWGMRDRRTNPCEDIECYPGHKREQFLAGKELQRLYSATLA